MRSSNDQKPQAVESFDACESGDECPHCAAGRPEAPEAAGDPADLSSSTWEVETDAQRFALPPTYHRAVYLDTLSPPGWFCAACWGDSVLTGWPCVVATRHASYISRAIHEERQAVRPGRVREATFMDAGDAARKIGRPDGLGVCFGNDHGYCCPVTWLKQPDGNAVDPDDLAAYQAIVGTHPYSAPGMPPGAPERAHRIAETMPTVGQWPGGAE